MFKDFYLFVYKNIHKVQHFLNTALLKSIYPLHFLEINRRTFFNQFSNKSNALDNYQLDIIHM